MSTVINGMDTLSGSEAMREGTIRDKLSDDCRALLDAAKDDPGTPFEPTAAAMLSKLRAGDPANWQRMRAELKRAGVFLGDIDRATSPATAGENGNGRATQTQSGNLIAIAAGSGCTLFHDEDDTFADVENGGHRETWPVRSRGFKLWLRYRYFTVQRGAPSNEALQSALNTIEAMARFQGEQDTVYRRVASVGQQLYLDLGDPAWRAVEIDQAGWSVVDRPTVRFVRSQTIRELPIPESGGSIASLRAFLNLASEDDFTLAVAWLLAALTPSGPYPVLVLTGEQGSAKSTCARLLRSLVDPQEAPLRSMPRDERDLFIAARNAHVLAFDNLSAMPGWLSDALCRISTGGGFATRELYTDTDEIVINAMRPIVLNGLDDVVVRGDLADRAIFLTLTAIPDEKRRLESDLLAAFERERPRILGALLDAIATGLGQLATVRLERLPRMADFAKWAVACERAVFDDGAFMEAYTGNRTEAVSAVIDASPVASAIRHLMEPRPEPWEGTPGELYGELSRIAGERVTKTRGWPANAQALSRSLNRINSVLRPAGILVTKGRSARRLMHISTQPQ